MYRTGKQDLLWKVDADMDHYGKESRGKNELQFAENHDDILLHFLDVRFLQLSSAQHLKESG